MLRKQPAIICRNVSHPEKNGDLNSSAEVLLRNNGKVVAASMNVGSGKLSWTGFNLPYHVIRDYNEQEANFLTNILDSLVDFSIKNTQSPNYQFISPERRVVQTDGARAVLFKEEAFPSWVAKTEKGLFLKQDCPGTISLYHSSFWR